MGYRYIKLRRLGFIIIVCGLLGYIAMKILLPTCTPTTNNAEYHERSSNTDRTADKHPTSYILHTHLLIIIISNPTNSTPRQVIRTTWASDLPPGTDVRFVMGTKGLRQDVIDKITDEHRKHKDLIILNDFQDSYMALTLKVLLAFKWVNENIKFNFLMKADEDTFIRVDEVLDELLNKPQKRLYWGFFDGRAQVKKIGKWKENDFVLCDRYLPYALGGGYVLSADLIGYLSINSEYFQILKSEDVSVGMWLGPLKIHRIHDPNFDTEWKSRGCFNSYIVTHKITTERMKRLHSNLQTSNKLCESETRLRYSYQYNWDIYPSLCCDRGKDRSIP